MAEGLYQFTVALTDKVSEPAHKAAEGAKEAGEGLKKAGEDAKKGEEGLRGIGEVMGQVKNTVTIAVAGITNSFAAMKSGEFGEAFQSASESMAGLAKNLDMVEPGLGEAVAALIEIGGLIGSITIGLIQKGAELALEATEAKEKMVAMFDALGGGVGMGEKTIKMLDGLSDEVGMTRDELAPLAKQFMAMGVRDLPKLQEALKATASAQAIMGQSGADAYVALSKKIQLAIESGGKLKISAKALGKQLSGVGLDLNDIATAMGTTGPKLAAALKAGTVDADKFGEAMQKALIEKGKGPLEKMAGSFEFLKKSFKENVMKLFEDVDVTPFTDALKSLGSIFGQNTASGKTLKWVVTSFFNEVFKLAAKVLPYLKHLFLDLIIIGLKLYIALKPYIKQLEALWQKAKGGEQLKLMLKGIAVVMALLAVTTFVALLPLILLTVALIAIGVAIAWLLGKIISFVPTAIKHLKKWATEAKDIAASFIDGLVSGITKGVGAVVDAVKNLGKSITKGLKGVLGISSPARVFMEMGLSTTAGFSGGVKQGTPAVAKATAQMGAAAIGGAAASVRTGPSGIAGGVGAAGFKAGSFAAPGTAPGSDRGGKDKKGGGHHIEVNVQIDGAGKSAQEITEEMVSTVFEKLALSQGL